MHELQPRNDTVKGILPSQHSSSAYGRLGLRKREWALLARKRQAFCPPVHPGSSFSQDHSSPDSLQTNISARLIESAAPSQPTSTADCPPHPISLGRDPLAGEMGNPFREFPFEILRSPMLDALAQLLNQPAPACPRHVQLAHQVELPLFNTLSSFRSPCFPFGFTFSCVCAER